MSQSESNSSNSQGSGPVTAQVSQNSNDSVLAGLGEISEAVKNLLENHEVTDNRIRDIQPSKLKKKSIPQDIHFSGDCSEDGQLFLNKLRRYAKYVEYGPEDVCALFPLLLSERALFWFEEQSERTKENWKPLHEAFLKRYGPSARSLIEETALLDRKQESTESVDKYTSDVMKRTALAGIRDPERWKTYVRGLQPKIRSYVIDKNPTSFEEAEVYARKGEQLHKMEDTSIIQQISALLPKQKPATSGEDDRLTKVETTLADLTERICVLTTKGSHESRPRTREPQNSGPGQQYRPTSRTTDGRPICEACKKVGHYTHACWTYGNNWTQQQQPQQFSRPPHNNGYQWNRQQNYQHQHSSNNWPNQNQNSQGRYQQQPNYQGQRHNSFQGNNGPNRNNSRSPRRFRSPGPQGYQHQQQGNASGPWY